MNGAEDPQELVVVEMLRKVQCERGIEVVGVALGEFDEVGTPERALSDGAGVAPLLGLPDEFLGEVDADIFSNSGCNQFEQDAVAAAKISHDFLTGQVEERQHPAHPLGCVRIVPIHIGLIVDLAQLII